MNTFAKLLVGTLQLLVACTGTSTSTGDNSVEGVEHIQQPGRSLQGRSLQGRGLQGTGEGVATVQQISIGGVSIENLHLEGTRLIGTLVNQTLSGADFVGATVVQQEADGTLFPSTITNVQSDPQDSSGEILLYTITAYNSATGKVENICAPDPWGQSWATPVSGTWDSTGAHISSTAQFMFGCTSGVVAKCVRWGYKPWKTINGSSLAGYHQACTRMARGDYCGDGVSHTQDGTLVDMYDLLGIQLKSPPELLSPLIFDGAWTPQGAYCVTKDRWLQLSQLLTVTAACKARFIDLFPLIETSPVDPLDICGVKRGDLSRSEVRIDNKSGLNIALN